jgi:uncharacterized protein YkwD
MNVPLVLAACAVACAVGAPLGVPARASASRGHCARAHVPVRSMPARQAEETILCLVNALRTGVGRRRMRSSASLSRAARRHAREMLTLGYLGHLDAAGLMPTGRVRGAGYPARGRSWAVAEALAFDSRHTASAATLVAQLRRSPPHRAILLSRTLRDIGVGVDTGHYGVMLTIDAGRRH